MGGESDTSAAASGPLVAVQPDDVRSYLIDVVGDSGAVVVPPEDAEVLIWTDPTDPAPLAELLERCPQITTVQLLWAGVEAFAEAGLFDDGRTWACGKGIYADPVAEHALALLLAGLRDLPARAAARSWGPQWGTSLMGGNVTILGGGGIATSLIRMLMPFEAQITVVRRDPSPMDGVARVLAADHTTEALADADAVVLALALTPETSGVIDAQALAAMPDHAWLVNVARGAHVVTEDLVDALRADVIAGAALDVTDPEPLPDGHPLWAHPNCLITPHVANTEEMARPLVTARIRANLRRFAAGESLLGLVDPALGY
ncbi:D-isomer specific 2-hydroxyacid dehydrogenase family protein [Euzebya tangerina]|uniref:D-isomer specific 2-hydroxyacid dehydrogenase family protein n=1 Tax=Euzebya tangerina TaxID=591198 RepID=UPI00196ACFA7|nr:D-isomer specific 2-hydroxyacid dehydrogenase family protein [Euzebya tangerina]